MLGKKTGGRKLGTPNKATVARQRLLDAMTAATATPLSFLLAVMRSESPLITMEMRIASARSALPYYHARVSEEVSPGDAAKLVECYTPDTDPLLSNNRRPKLAGVDSSYDADSNPLLMSRRVPRSR
jgi:hypothetical protein